ncbi:MAG: AI-2E family transporter [SAR324 cluster bacterium]|uniref:AI-2E family transporter n=1 Tax=SAR324 cluster bacterium TaxID=2024889 RepID=A0A7X9IK26_9DELT|nr:AI-2E family transporter [SAR324 cluster bacterium]
MMQANSNLSTQRWIVGATCIVGLLIGIALILRPFLVPLLWASVLAISSYPLFKVILRFSPRRRNLSALLSSIIMALVVASIIFPFLFSIAKEMETLTKFLQTFKEQGHPDFILQIQKIPFVGQILHNYVNQLQEEEALLVDLLSQYRAQLLRAVGFAAKNILSFFAQYLVCFFALFFLYRDGNKIANQLKALLTYVVGEHLSSHIIGIKGLVKAAVYGTLLTAVIQGILAGIGYAVCGVSAPIFLGLLTALFALIPFGTPVVYVSVSVALFLSEVPLYYPIGLFIWGVCVVSLADNVIRPFFISQATELPIILVFFGVLGGIAAFGSIGVFLGPVVMVVAIALWKELLGAANLNKDDSFA